ncbi:MAG: sensor histidine kinase [Acidimicrobiales bacterium]
MTGGISRLDEGLLTGVAAFRSLTWIWAAIALITSMSSLAEPQLAIGLIGAAGVFTAVTAVAVRERPLALVRPTTVMLEIAMGAALIAADPIVYDGDRAQSLGSAWPVSGLMAAGIATGPRGGALAGVVLTLARALATGLDPTLRGTVSAMSAGMLYILAGWVAGYAAQKLREAESEISTVRARESVAQEPHNGVLQTLAALQRRSADAAIVQLARVQERRLRDFLSGDKEPVSGDLVDRIRQEMAEFEQTWESRAEVVVVDAPTGLEPEATRAVIGAVGEAATNAAKHGRATRITICVDVDEDAALALITVHDNGSGFDPTAVERRGMTSSIICPIDEIGGSVDIASSTSGGSDVEIRVPVSLKARP